MLPLLASVLLAPGCDKQETTAASGAEESAALAAKPESSKPAGPFSLAWSEYPSWSVFDVAHAKGYLNGAEGKLGELEKKWNVDVVLKEAEYDPCITMYGAGEVDAVAITNMDILKPSLSRPAVAILPTSTSYGADAVLVTKKIKKIKDLMKKKIDVRGLDLSVSEYMFARNLELKGEDPTKFGFKSMDPGAAAMAMQQKQKGVDAIAVWNPFVIQTLEKRKDVRVLFDSTSIPGEIVDMVAMAKKSLEKPGGDAFAHAIIDAYYAVNRDLADPAKRNSTLVAIGEKFANLSADKMETVVKQTRFYGTADLGVGVFTDGAVLPGVSDKKLKELMTHVIEFSSSHGIVDKKPNVVFGDTVAGKDANLRFDASYMQAVAKAMN